MIQVKRFNVTKGVDNIYVFNIKRNESVEPMPILPSDTFVVKIIRLRDQVEVLSKVPIVKDAEAGKLELIITSNDTNQLESSRGTYADRYYNVATHRILIEANTQVNGEFIAHIGKVYVK